MYFNSIKKCLVKKCGNKYLCSGYCSKHYYQVKRNGKILERTKFDRNEFIDCGDYYEICLYNAKHEIVAKSKIDKETYNDAKDIKWGLSDNGYVRNVRLKIRLHHLVLPKHTTLDVDHINRDKLDNRKVNLRYATRSENMKNVDWSNRKSKQR